jgi:hypothetical protein
MILPKDGNSKIRVFMSFSIVSAPKLQDCNHKDHNSVICLHNSICVSVSSWDKTGSKSIFKQISYTKLSSLRAGNVSPFIFLFSGFNMLSKCFIHLTFLLESSLTWGLNFQIFLSKVRIFLKRNLPTGWSKGLYKQFLRPNLRMFAFPPFFFHKIR